jgi:hypothetical protein
MCVGTPKTFLDSSLQPLGSQDVVDAESPWTGTNQPDKQYYVEDFRKIEEVV